MTNMWDALIAPEKIVSQAAQVKIKATISKGTDQFIDDFALRMKTLRKDKGLTHAALARLMKIDPTGVSRLEHGKRQPNLSQIYKLAVIFGVSPGYLVEGK